MEVRSLYKNFKMSPQKVREVVRQVRGMNAQQALGVLQFVPRKSAQAVAKTLKSAIAVEHNLVETDFDIAGNLPAQGAPAETFTVTAAANSGLYFGSTSVTVTYP